jgi:hypothetical protein
MTDSNTDTNQAASDIIYWSAGDSILYDPKSNMLGLYDLINKDNWRHLLLKDDEIKRAIILSMLVPEYATNIAILQGKIDTSALQIAKRFPDAMVYLVSDDVFGLSIMAKVRKIEGSMNLRLVKYEKIVSEPSKGKMDVVYVTNPHRTISIHLAGAFQKINLLELASRIIKDSGRVLASFTDPDTALSLSVMKKQITTSGLIIKRLYRIFPSASSPKVLTDESGYKELSMVNYKRGLSKFLKTYQRIKARGNFLTYCFDLRINDRRSN